MSRKIPECLAIELPFLCPQCLEEFGRGKTLSEGRLTVGWTAIGMQVWCQIHNRNVIHMIIDRNSIEFSKSKERKRKL